MMSISKLQVEKILFLDIETVPEIYEFKDLDTKTAELYQQKVSYFLKDDTTVEEVYQRAGIYAEFGKIVCISCGLVRDHSTTGKSIRMKSFAGDDER